MRNKGFFQITFLVLILVFAFSATTAFAINTDSTVCPSVDIRKQVTLSETRDQKFLGWCYAYAASDLFTAKFGHPFSTLDLALLVAHDRAKNNTLPQTRLVDVGSGSFNDVLKAVNKHGFCSGFRFSENDPNSAEALALAEDLANLVKRERALGRITDDQIAVLVSSKMSSLKLIFPEVKENQLIQIFQKIGQERFPILNVAEKVCGGRTKIKIPIAGAGNASNDRMEVAKRILIDGKAIYILWAEKTLKNLDLPIGQPGHASNIIAMRFDNQNQQCEFLIRNSYGANIKNSLDPRIHEDVEGGNIWVSQDLAEKMIFSIHWLR